MSDPQAVPGTREHMLWLWNFVAGSRPHLEEAGEYLCVHPLGGLKARAARKKGLKYTEMPFRVYPTVWERRGVVQVHNPEMFERWLQAWRPKLYELLEAERAIRILENQNDTDLELTKAPFRMGIL